MKIQTKFISSLMIISVMILVSGVPLSFAQTKEPKTTSGSAQLSPTTAKKESDDTIQILKEKIEKKVDEINKKSKKIIIGIVDKKTDETLNIHADDSKEYVATVDETISKLFYAGIDGLEEEKDLLKIKEKARVIISGPILESQISANTIYLQKEYLVENGQIINVDKENFSIDVVTSEKIQMTLDIEKITKQKIINTKTLEMTQAGFSKYKTGDSIHFVVEKSQGEKSSTALRTLIIPQEFFINKEPTH